MKLPLRFVWIFSSLYLWFFSKQPWLVRVIIIFTKIAQSCPENYCLPLCLCVWQRLFMCTNTNAQTNLLWERCCGSFFFFFFWLCKISIRQTERATESKNIQALGCQADVGSSRRNWWQRISLTDYFGQQFCENIQKTLWIRLSCFWGADR